MHKPHCHPRCTLLAVSCIVLFGYAATVVAGSEQLSTLKDQKSVAVTIYNNDLALIKDVRSLFLINGDFNLAWRDVSGLMRPETASLRSIAHPGSIAIVEQNFNFDLLTPQSLLNKYVGQMVSVVKINPATGVESRESAVVLAAGDGVVLKMDDRIETGLPGRITFENVPGNLRDRPTLVIEGNHKGQVAEELELSYLTGGLSWKADYVAELNDAENQLDLSAWVTLTNTSGTRYANAKLQLVAGDIHRVQQEFAAPLAQRAKMAAAAVAEPMRQESLMDYHLYTLDRLTTIAENQTKQVALLNAAGVPARKELVLMGGDYYYASSYGDLGQKLKVNVWMQFDNSESARLGIPLPKGILRAYKRDKAGNAQFVGEDQIDHTPKNESVRVKLGQSFDVTANKKQIDFKQLSTGNTGNSGANRFESAYEITLKNAKKETATVMVQEPIPGDWKIVEESHPHDKPASNTAIWKVDIPAEGSATLKYRVQVKF
ncbi:MAG: DUF4139 domain-containing protein [Gammaproteobacteria bacterium]|nr:MAG: DUF4139 domain-containing protein [Gammaproteobacteria bacterium]